jgi:hypothetical protein
MAILTMTLQINTKMIENKEKKSLQMCSSTYKFMVIQISCNFIIV